MSLDSPVPSLPSGHCVPVACGPWDGLGDDEVGTVSASWTPCDSVVGERVQAISLDVTFVVAQRCLEEGFAAGDPGGAAAGVRIGCSSSLALLTLNGVPLKCEALQAG